VGLSCARTAAGKNSHVSCAPAPTPC
jgi:hypothetical protein